MGRVLASMVAVAALAAAGSGCGATDAINPDVVAHAADATSSAGGANLAMSVDADGQTITGTGFLGAQGREMVLRLAFPGGTGTMEIALIHAVMYIHAPAGLKSKLPSGKSWLKVDMARATGVSPAAFGGSDPYQAVEVLRGAGSVKRIGTDSVRGATTTHYSAVIDLRRAVDSAPAAARDRLRRVIDKAIKQSGHATVPTDVWIDGKGRLRRERTVEKVGGHTVHTTLDLFDFGTRRIVTAPPADTTYDATEQVAKQFR